MMSIADYTNYIDSVYQKSSTIKSELPIYHYTSTANLSSILRKEKITLFFSNANYSNDITEGKDVINILKSVLEDIKKEKIINDNSFLQSISDFTPTDFEAIPFEKDKNMDPKFIPVDQYICSFSKNNNSLDMWRYYLKDKNMDGYCIGFSKKIFNDVDFTFTTGEKVKIKWFNVIYDDNNKKKFIKDAIIKFYKIYTERTTDSFSVLWLGSLLFSLFNYLRFCFKNKCFAHEEEIRALIILPKNQKDKEIKFRNSNGILIPYIDIETDKKYFESVKLSPVMSNDAIEATKFFLHYRDYPDGKVDKSDLPIRY